MRMFCSKPKKLIWRRKMITSYDTLSISALFSLTLFSVLLQIRMKRRFLEVRCSFEFRVSFSVIASTGELILKVNRDCVIGAAEQR